MGFVIDIYSLIQLKCCTLNRPTLPVQCGWAPNWYLLKPYKQNHAEHR